MAVAASQTVNYDRLYSTTTAHNRHKVAYQIVQANRLVWWLFRSRSVMYEGGTESAQPVVLEETDNVRGTDPYEEFDTAVEDGPDSARYIDTFRTIGSMKLSESEKAKNRGKAKVVSLSRAKQTTMRLSFQNELSKQIFGTNSASPKNIRGLQDLIHAAADGTQSGVVNAQTATVGLISKTNYANWRNRYRQISTFGDNGLDQMETVHMQCTEMGRSPNIAPMDSAVYRFLKKEFGPNQRESSKIWPEGFKNILFEGTPTYPEKQLDNTGRIYMLTTSGDGMDPRHDLKPEDFKTVGGMDVMEEFEGNPGIYLPVLKGRDFAMTPFRTPHNGDYVVRHLILESYGLCTNSMKNQGVLDFSGTVEY